MLMESQGLVSLKDVFDEANQRVAAVENYSRYDKTTLFTSVHPLVRDKSMKALAQLSSTLGWITSATKKDLLLSTHDRSPTRPLAREASTVARSRWTSREAESRDAEKPFDEELRHYNSEREVQDLLPRMAKLQLQLRGYIVREADDPNAILRRVTGLGTCRCRQNGLPNGHEHMRCIVAPGRLFTQIHFKRMMRQELIRHVDSARRVLFPTEQRLSHTGKSHQELHEELGRCIDVLRSKFT